MTKEKTKSAGLVKVQSSSANLAIKFGEDEIKLIKENICPQSTEAEFNLFMYDCQSRGLNPLRNEIFWIKRGTKATHQISIDGQRLIAQRTGEYEGQTDVEYGQDIEFQGITAPEYAKIGVYRKRFTSPLYARAYFKEYAQIYNGKLSNMWSKFPKLMILKCAESQALRKAFPDSLSGIYTDDEMAQASKPTEVIDAETGEVKEPVAPVLATNEQIERLRGYMSQLAVLLNWTEQDKEDNLKKLLNGRKKLDLTNVQIETLLALLEERVKKESQSNPAR